MKQLLTMAEFERRGGPSRYFSCFVDCKKVYLFSDLFFKKDRCHLRLVSGDEKAI